MSMSFIVLCNFTGLRYLHTSPQHLHHSHDVAEYNIIIMEKVSISVWSDEWAYSLTFLSMVLKSKEGWGSNAPLFFLFMCGETLIPYTIINLLSHIK